MHSNQVLIESLEKSECMQCTVLELDIVGIQLNIEDSSAMTFRINREKKTKNDDFTSIQHIYPV